MTIESGADFAHFIERQQKVRVKRSLGGHQTVNGYVMMQSNDLVLMHCFHDFMPDGYSIFRKDSVESVRSSEYERHWERMLASEQLLRGLEKNLDVDVSSMQTAIMSIQARYGGMTIECEELDSDDEDFYIGEAVEVKDGVLLFDSFDALGHWSETTDEVPVSEITFLQFATPYEQTFRKYVVGVPAAKRADGRDSD